MRNKMIIVVSLVVAGVMTYLMFSDWMRISTIFLEGLCWLWNHVLAC